MNATQPQLLQMALVASDVALDKLPIGTLRTPNGLYSGLWALPRPTTKHWGSGVLIERLEQVWGACDVKFGRQDNVDGFTVDIAEASRPTIVANWNALPFKNGAFRVGYWDPPYLGRVGKDGDVHYNRMDDCLREICRVLSERLFILSPLIYPCPDGWQRSAVIAVTMGPNKVIRALQGFCK